MVNGCWLSESIESLVKYINILPLSAFLCLFAYFTVKVGVYWPFGQYESESAVHRRATMQPARLVPTVGDLRIAPQTVLALLIRQRRGGVTQR